MGEKEVKTSSKWAHFTGLRIPNGPRSLLEKRGFDPFFTLGWSWGARESNTGSLVPRHSTSASVSYGDADHWPLVP